MADPLKPSAALLVKLGSVAVHADEFLSPAGHPFDRVAIRSLLDDPEVMAWVKQMDALALLPRKRNPHTENSIQSRHDDTSTTKGK